MARSQARFLCNTDTGLAAAREDLSKLVDAIQRGENAAASRVISVAGQLPNTPPFWKAKAQMVRALAELRQQSGHGDVRLLVIERGTRAPTQSGTYAINRRHRCA